MSLLFMLILPSSPDKAMMILAPVAQDPSISRSPVFDQSIRFSTSRITGIGRSEDKLLVFSNVTQDVGSNLLPPGLFEAGPEPIPHVLPFQINPGVSLATFCAIYELDCGLAPPHLRIVYKGSPDEGGDREAVDGMPPGLLTFPRFETINERTSVTLSTIERNVKRSLVIVLPHNWSNDTSGSESATAMLRQEVSSIDSIRRFFGDGKASGSSEQLPSAGRDSMNRISSFIADVARQGQGLVPEDGLALLQAAVEWQQTHGRRFGDHFASDKFLHSSAFERLTQATWSLIEGYLESVAQDMSRGFRAFEVKTGTEIEETAEKAITEFRQIVDGFPPYLRRLVTPEQLDAEIHFLRYHLTDRVPDRVETRRAELKREFERNCTTTFRAQAHEAILRIHFWNSWIPGIEAEWLRRFSDAVHYNDLPPAMQQVIGKTYDSYLDFTRSHVREEVETTRMVALGIVFLAIMFRAGIVYRRPTRRTE
jgi:hypothetical protein